MLFSQNQKRQSEEEDIKLQHFVNERVKDGILNL